MQYIDFEYDETTESTYIYAKQGLYLIASIERMMHSGDYGLTVWGKDITDEQLEDILALFKDSVKNNILPGEC